LRSTSRRQFLSWEIFVEDDGDCPSLVIVEKNVS